MKVVPITRFFYHNPRMYVDWLKTKTAAKEILINQQINPFKLPLIIPSLRPSILHRTSEPLSL